MSWLVHDFRGFTVAGPLRDVTAIPRFEPPSSCHAVRRTRRAPTADRPALGITLTAVIEVVGVQAGGVPSLPDELRSLVLNAAVLVGSPRLLESMTPASAQRRLEWPRPLLAGLGNLLRDLVDGPQPVVVLATGDPLDSGIGTTLIRRLGADNVRIHPAVGAVALARARMGWSTSAVDAISLVSTPAYAVRRYLTRGRQLLALSADESTPAAVAAELTDAGWPQARLTVLGDLGTGHESRHDLIACDFSAYRDLPRLNVVAVAVPDDGPTIGTSPGRDDEQFENDGQLTKREIRACALAALRPAPGQLLWDLGAGAGSIAIEWALHDPRCRAVAVERDPDRAARIERNVARTGAVGVRVLNAAIHAAVPDLPTPDAVFLGGGADRRTIAAAWSALRPGGRLVVHTVTLETEQLVVEAMRRYGGKLRRITIERAEPLGRYLSWKPARPVVEWAVTRESPALAAIQGNESPTP